METSKDEVVIAVMGVTGSGKSTFIREITGDTSIYVGHGLESATTEVQSYRFTYNGTRFILVDTPGFNDTFQSDEVVMNKVLDWLESSFRKGTRLNGVLYLHRITDARMQGSAFQNMRMFRQLCGPACFQNVTLATTFWEVVNPYLGRQRERELKQSPEFWGSMIAKGSQIVRLGRNKEEGLRVLEKFSKKGKVTLKSQEEMVTEQKSRSQTAAALAVNAELARQREEFDARLAEQKRQNALDLERQRIAREARITQEKERLRVAEEERQRREVARRAREERKWQVKYEKRQRGLEQARQEQARAKREEELIATRRRQAKARQKAEEERLLEVRRAYYRSYTCLRESVQNICCDKCKAMVPSGSYYHCCFCLGDNYDQCTSCGRCCPVYEHPLMKEKYYAKKEQDGCRLM